MPYKDPKKRAERQKIYRLSPRVKELEQQRRDRFYAKRRARKLADAKQEDAPLTVDASALTQALGAWGRSTA